MTKEYTEKDPKSKSLKFEKETLTDHGCTI